jgi:hypothetical protein
LPWLSFRYEDGRGGKITQRLARAAGRSRSEVYSAALREYVARHEPDDVTEAVNRVIEDLGEEAVPDGFTQEAVRQVLGPPSGALTGRCVAGGPAPSPSDPGLAFAGLSS